MIQYHTKKFPKCLAGEKVSKIKRITREEQTIWRKNIEILLRGTVCFLIQMFQLSSNFMVEVGDCIILLSAKLRLFSRALKKPDNKRRKEDESKVEDTKVI